MKSAPCARGREIEELRLEAAPVKAPAGIVVQAGVDLGQGHGQPVAGHEQPQRADPAPKIKRAAGAVGQRGLQRLHLNQGAVVLTERMPPGQIVEVGISLPVKRGDVGGCGWRGFTPCLCQLGRSGAAARLHPLDRLIEIRRQLGDDFSSQPRVDLAGRTTPIIRRSGAECERRGPHLAVGINAGGNPIHSNSHHSRCNAAASSAARASR